MPTLKKHRSHWLSAISSNADTIVNPDGSVTTDLAVLEFRDAEMQLTPGTAVRVIYRGIDYLHCISLEDALSVDKYWKDLELARIAAVIAEKKRINAETKVFNAAIKLPCSWIVVRRNVATRGGVVTHIQVIEAIVKPIRRKENALLCGAAIGVNKTINLGSQERITCAGCLAILARGKRTKITPKGE